MYQPYITTSLAPNCREVCDMSVITEMKIAAFVPAGALLRQGPAMARSAPFPGSSALSQSSCSSTQAPKNKV